MTNSNISMLTQQLEMAVESLLRMIDGLDQSVLYAQPGGRANSIAATIGHVFAGTDGLVNGLIQGKPPLFATMPTGLSELPPSGPELFNWFEWGTRVQLDLPTTITYGKAVFASVNEYIATLSDEDLAATIQTPVGEFSRFFLINGAILNNLLLHTGEISTIRGQHGLQGYVR